MTLQENEVIRAREAAFNYAHKYYGFTLEEDYYLESLIRNLFNIYKSKISNKDFVITLKIKGKKLNSVQLSKFINENISNNIIFIIGGSYGLSNDVLKRSNYALSFSDLTFPHQLFRVILLEQLYRSFKIINNESYHK